MKSSHSDMSEPDVPAVSSSSNQMCPSESEKSFYDPSELMKHRCVHHLEGQLRERGCCPGNDSLELQ